jgi:hypothetical protein
MAGAFVENAPGSRHDVLEHVAAKWIQLAEKGINPG